MEDSLQKTSNTGGSKHYIMLTKDRKPISRTLCDGAPDGVPYRWSLGDFVQRTKIGSLPGLPQFSLYPAGETSRDRKEWGIFLRFMMSRDMVAVSKSEFYEFYILPPIEALESSHTCVAYKMVKRYPVDASMHKSENYGLLHPTVNSHMNAIRVPPLRAAPAPHVHLVEEPARRVDLNTSEDTRSSKFSRSFGDHPQVLNVKNNGRPKPHALKQDAVIEKNYVRADPIYLKTLGQAHSGWIFGAVAELVDNTRDAPAPHAHLVEEPARRVDLNTSEDTRSSKFSQSFGDHPQVSNVENNGRPKPHALKQDAVVEKNYARADPSYLKTLGQAHSGWIFGAVAELVDNARDAKATKLDISIDTIYSNKASENIPLLSIIDDGHGMTHQEIVRMTCFGHKQPEAYEPERIGRFGVGFKTGAMRLGRDALVLTQTANSRSIAFLSQSLNEGKDNLEIPIVSYRREGQIMEVDTNAQSSALAKYNLKAIKEFSPFNKYLIGEKAGLFHEGTGTQIYIWNLDKWGSDYSLEWHTGLKGGSSFHQGDIFIRSRRIRSRPGQISQQVRLDYSLRSYMEVIFLLPRMKIYVQGSLVKSRPLEKSLNKTVIETGNVMGKHVQLTLGRCQLEWEQANCGIFLYWHGRLIEAYKRVGGMVHSADVGRGVIGVIDVTDVMDDGNGSVWVHNNKQGFQDSEPYAHLEEWLGRKADEYWDNNFDSLQLKKSNSLYKPDQEWVQCDKCRKWRMLSSNWGSKNLPLEWFCFMEPFKGSCETPEQKVQRGVITVSAKRSGYDIQQKPTKFDGDAVNVSNTSEGDKDDSDQDMEDGKNQGLKRLRRGLPRACKRLESMP